MGPKLKQSLSLGVFFKKLNKHSKHSIYTINQDYEAANDKELSLLVNQEVEVLEVYSNPAGPPWCLVKTLAQPSFDKLNDVYFESQEGVIPSIILKSFPKGHHGVSHKAYHTRTKSTAMARPSSEDLTLLDLPPEFRPRSRSSSALHWKSKTNTAPSGPASKTLRRFFSTKVSSKKRPHVVKEVARSDISSVEPIAPEDSVDSLTAVPGAGWCSTASSAGNSMEQICNESDPLDGNGSNNNSKSPTCADDSTCDEQLIIQSSPDKQQQKISPDGSEQLSLQMEENCNIRNEGEGENLLNGRMEDSQTEVKPEMSEEDLQEAAKQKRSYVLMELLETEKDYVEDLSNIVNGYMEGLKSMELPEDLIGKDKIVFGNIHQIFDFHKETFLPEIERLVSDAQGLGLLFKRYERRLYMYVKYCENKPKSEFIVAEYIDTVFNEIKRNLNHRLQLTDLLIKPVQRIMKYQLLLKDILKYTRRSGESCDSLEDAIKVMHVVPKAANDMMNVGRLQGFDGKLTAQGKLLLQDTLPVAEFNPNKPDLKFKERRMFLFEQIIIFSEVIESKSSLSAPHYVFKHSIKINKMSLENEVAENCLLFKLIDKTPGSCATMFIQTMNVEHKKQWTSQIRNMLDMQGNFLRALQSPIAFQKGGQGYDTLDDGRVHTKSKPITDDIETHITTASTLPTQKKSSLFDTLRKGKTKPVSSTNGARSSKMPFVRVLTKCSADGIDEISCSRGDMVQVLGVHHLVNRFLVYKPACSHHNLDVEGWIHGFSLGVMDIGQEAKNFDTIHSPSVHYLSAGDEERADKKLRLKLMRRRSKSPQARPIGSWQEKLSMKINALSSSMAEPSFNFEPDSVTVKVGEEAMLECHISGKPKPNIFWKTADGRIALPGDRMEWFESDYGHYAFSLKGAVMSDTGSYSCLAVSEMGAVERFATIDIMDVSDPPGKPTITVLQKGSVSLTWDLPIFDGHTPIEGYLIETSNNESCEWVEAVAFVKENTQVIHKLDTGLTHLFRVRALNSAGVSVPSLVSDPLVIAAANIAEKSENTSLTWKPHFEHLHKLDSIISRFDGGEMRFYVNISSASRVIAKCINSKEKAITEKEIFSAFDHNINILHPTEFYGSSATHFLILPNIQRPLLEQLCELPSVPEVDLVLYSRQIVKAIHCLQEQKILHLNILPETILVTPERIVKLSGFEKAVFTHSGSTTAPGKQAGEFENLTNHTATHYSNNIEFQPVEITSGEGLGDTTDIWSVGVFIYLMLCGITPFYNENPEVMKEKIGQINLQVILPWLPQVSEGCITLLKVMFIRNPRMRPLAMRCMQCSWLNVLPEEGNTISTERLSSYLENRGSSRNANLDERESSGEVS